MIFSPVSAGDVLDLELSFRTLFPNTFILYSGNATQVGVKMIQECSYSTHLVTCSKSQLYVCTFQVQKLAIRFVQYRYA